MKSWLRLTRVGNLSIILFVFLVFRYGLLFPLDVATALSDLQYLLLAFSVVLIAAGGYIINDINDKKADRINKPGKNVIGVKISEKKARLAYWIVSLLGLGIGYFMGYSVGLSVLGGIHLISFFLLWMYSTDFKHRPFIGNFIVSLMSFLLVITIPLFDVIPSNRSIIAEYITLFYIFGAYAAFAFLTTFIRELIKDAQDLEGDRRVGSKTLAIRLGEQSFKILVIVLLAVLAISLFLTGYYFRESPVVLGYVFIFLFSPTLINIYFVWKSEGKNDWNRSSMLMKLISVFGITSVVVITFLA